MYFTIGRYVYYDDPNMIGGEPTRCGEWVRGIDGYYVQWYA